MSLPGLTINPYDELPFPSQPVLASHPDRMAAVARLFGMQPAPPGRCRLLELGCATGGNLLPMADRFPESQFVGVDYARAQLDIAQRSISQLGLRNVELRHADIAKLDDSLGKFDYIICHGVYSWVPNELQDKILQLCRDALAPQGLAYISYNTNPGWFLKGQLREMMCNFATPTGSAKQRLDQGRALLAFFASAGERLDSPYAKLLKHESQDILRMPDGYVFHEYFESDNRPLYFHQFVQQIGHFDLQFMGESAVGTMFLNNFSPMIREHIKNLSFGMVDSEQHLDWTRFRGFRQSLVCHKQVPLERHLNTESVAHLRFCGRVRPQSATVDLRSHAPETFHAPSGAALTTGAPHLKAVLLYLHDNWPRTFTRNELLAAIHRLLGADDKLAEPEVLAGLSHSLIQCIATGVLDISAAPDDFVLTISEHPRVSDLSRLEAQYMRAITNRRHELIELDDTTRHIVPHLDGQHDRAALVSELKAAVDRGDVSILHGGLPVKDETLLPILEQSLERALAKLAVSAALIA